LHLVRRVVGKGDITVLGSVALFRLADDDLIARQAFIDELSALIKFLDDSRQQLSAMSTTSGDEP